MFNTIGNIIGAQYIVPTGAGYSAEYQAVLDFATTEPYTPPSSTVQDAGNTLIAALIAAEVWDDIDLLYIFKTDGDQDFATINWKDPESFQGILVNSPTFTENLGFKSNGTSSYIETNWVPDTDGVNFAEDDASVMVGLPTNGVNSQYIFCTESGSSNVRRLSMFQHPAAGQVSVGLNTQQISCVGLGVDNVSGFMYTETPADNDLDVYKNNEDVTSLSATPATTTPSTLSLNLLCFKSFSGGRSNYYVNDLEFFIVGKSLTTEKRTALYSALTDYYYLAAATAAYQAVLDEATSQFMTLPTSEEQATHMQLIISLMVVNIWDQLDIFYPMVTNADFATLNWKNPTEYQLVLVNSPTYDSNGFTGDGTSYLSTDWAPNDGVSFTLNEAGIGGYETFNLSEIGFLFGSKGVSAGQDGCQLRTRFSDTALGRLNSTTALSIANTSSLGTWQVNRISSTTINLFKNGSSIGSSSANTTARNSYPIYLLGQNDAGTPASLSSRSIKAFWSGASLNGLESILHSIIWNFYTP